jgi:hypothetical protein
MNVFQMAAIAAANDPYGVHYPQFASSFDYPSAFRTTAPLPYAQPAMPVESFGEQVFDFGVEMGLKAFAPPLLPVYQALDRLEESPNLTAQQRQGLRVGEALVAGYVLYKVIQSLRN